MCKQVRVILLQECTLHSAMAQSMTKQTTNKKFCFFATCHLRNTTQPN